MTNTELRTAFLTSVVLDCDFEVTADSVKLTWDKVVAPELERRAAELEDRRLEALAEGTHGEHRRGE